jgi:hypothetical protein
MEQPANRPLVTLAGCKHFWCFFPGALADFPDHHQQKDSCHVSTEIMVCVAIYATLVQNIAITDDVSTAVWTCIGYTALLCFTLFKTSSLAKSVFNAH